MSAQVGRMTTVVVVYPGLPTKRSNCKKKIETAMGPEPPQSSTAHRRTGTCSIHEAPDRRAVGQPICCCRGGRQKEPTTTHTRFLARSVWRQGLRARPIANGARRRQEENQNSSGRGILPRISCAASLTSPTRTRPKRGHSTSPSRVSPTKCPACPKHRTSNHPDTTTTRSARLSHQICGIQSGARR